MTASTPPTSFTLPRPLWPSQAIMLNRGGGGPKSLRRLYHAPSRSRAAGKGKPEVACSNCAQHALFTAAASGSHKIQSHTNAVTQTKMMAFRFFILAKHMSPKPPLTIDICIVLCLVKCQCCAKLHTKLGTSVPHLIQLVQ